jgi:putative FmdB family regulatory protein
MPIFTYRCKDCGKVFDFLMMKANEKVLCTKCQSTNIEKQITAPSSIRVGSGQTKGSTCCGRSERCDTPPCSDGSCIRD